MQMVNTFPESGSPHNFNRRVVPPSGSVLGTWNYAIGEAQTVTRQEASFLKLSSHGVEGPRGIDGRQCENRAMGPAMKLAGLLACGSPWLRLALALLERRCRAYEILQGRLIDLVAFMDVDGAPGVALEAG